MHERGRLHLFAIINVLVLRMVATVNRFFFFFSTDYERTIRATLKATVNRSERAIT